jgi:hypothetical protein
MGESFGNLVTMVLNVGESFGNKGMLLLCEPCLHVAVCGVVQGSGEESFTCTACLKTFDTDKHLHYHLTHDHAAPSTTTNPPATKRLRGSSKGAALPKPTTVVIVNTGLPHPVSLISTAQPPAGGASGAVQPEISRLSHPVAGNPRPVQIHINRHHQVSHIQHHNILGMHFMHSTNKC